MPRASNIITPCVWEVWELVTLACWHMSSKGVPLHHIKGVGNSFNHSSGGLNKVPGIKVRCKKKIVQLADMDA